MKLILPIQMVGDSTLHYRRFAEAMTDVASARGIETEIIYFPSMRFIPTLMKRMADKNNVVIFTLLIFDPQLQAFIANRKWMGFSKCKATLLSLISDHAFTGFFQNGVINADPRTKFLSNDPTFEREFKLFNPTLKNSTFRTLSLFPLLYYDQNKVEPYDTREIDVLISLRVLDPRGSLIQDFLKHTNSSALSEVAKNTYDDCVFDTSCNPVDIFDKHFRALAGNGIIDILDDHEQFRAILNLLSGLDEVIRQARRTQMLTEILRSSGKLNVCITGSPMPWIKTSSNVKFVESVSADKFADLLAISKSVVNCSPTYPYYVHERITNAMAYGATSITDITPGVATFFATNEFVAYDYNNPQSLTKIFAHNDMREIGQRSRLRVLQEPRFFWDAFLDEVIAIAAL